MNNKRGALTQKQVAALKAYVTWKLRFVHVGTSNRDVLSLFYQKLIDLGATRKQRKIVYWHALKEHQRNRDLYAYVMGGH